MITISLCMIVKNEEEVIGRCLDSVYELVDEINIVDTGSTDRTKEVVRKYTDRIFDFKWVDDFAAARNFSFQKATKQYILWLDADDVLTEENIEKFKSLKQSLSEKINAISMIYQLSFDMQGNVTSFLRRYRLVKRSQNFQWIGAVHEYLQVSGQLHESAIAVTHFPLHHDRNRNIKIYEKQLQSGKTLSPRDTFYYANELLDHLRFQEAANYYETFLNDNKGWIEDSITACFKLADCYFQMNNQQKMLAAIFRSFTYDVPRPEASCRIGYFFMEQQDHLKAIFWYQQALKSGSISSNALQNTAFSTWLPHLQLCVLYDRLQQYEKAYFHNECARQFRPQNEHILSNKVYLEKRLNKTQSAE